MKVELDIKTLSPKKTPSPGGLIVSFIKNKGKKYLPALLQTHSQIAKEGRISCYKLTCAPIHMSEP
jgi:hypothetical protein